MADSLSEIDYFVETRLGRGENERCRTSDDPATFLGLLPCLLYFSVDRYMSHQVVSVQRTTKS